MNKKEKLVWIDEIVADASLVFNAGTDTSSSTLEYGLLLSCKFQDIQKNLRNELLSVSSVHDSSKDISSNKVGIIIARIQLNYGINQYYISCIYL